MAGASTDYNSGDYLDMPAGFEVAPDSDGIAENVVAKEFWNVWRVCTASKCYATKHYLAYDNLCGSGTMCVKDDDYVSWERNSIGQIRVKKNLLWRRVLIRKQCQHGNPSNPLPSETPLVPEPGHGCRNHPISTSHSLCVLPPPPPRTP